MTEDELAPLHAKYFDLVHATYPFVSRQRFASEEPAGLCPLPKQALKYAVALMGSTALPLHAHLCRPCYRLARKYMELCEQSDQEADLINLNTFQALLLVIRYEIMGKSLKKAWMTLGRAIRLSKMMQLEIFDTDRIARQSEAPSPRLNTQEADGAEEKGETDTSEEWRKSFWALYMLESYASTRTGMACELGDASVKLFLRRSWYSREPLTPTHRTLSSSCRCSMRRIKSHPRTSKSYFKIGKGSIRMSPSNYHPTRDVSSWLN